MITDIIPKLPMRDKAVTKDYYVNQLGFTDIGSQDFDGYLILGRDQIEIHFFEFKDLDPKENYGQVYIRIEDIDSLYQSVVDNDSAIHPSGHLQIKPWGQKEFSMLDPDHNLLTFGQNV
jgi:hypothetical protein